MYSNNREDKIINEDILAKLDEVPHKRENMRKLPIMVWSCAT